MPLSRPARAAAPEWTSRAVGAYLGIVPRQRASRQRQPQLRITKAGDQLLRRLLVAAAHYVLGPLGPDADLRRWGLRYPPPGARNATKRGAPAGGLAASPLGDPAKSTSHSGSRPEAGRNGLGKDGLTNTAAWGRLRRRTGPASVEPTPNLSHPKRERGGGIIFRDGRLDDAAAALSLGNGAIMWRR